MNTLVNNAVIAVVDRSELQGYLERKLARGYQLLSVEEATTARVKVTLATPAPSRYLVKIFPTQEALIAGREAVVRELGPDWALITRTEHSDRSLTLVYGIY